MKEDSGKRIMTKEGRKIFDPKEKIMRVANGTTSSMLGRVFLPVELDGVNKEVALRIARKVTSDCILGQDSIRKFGLIKNGLRDSWNLSRHSGEDHIVHCMV